MVYTSITKYATTEVDGLGATPAIHSVERRVHATGSAAPIPHAPATGKPANGGCISPAPSKLPRETSNSVGPQLLPNAWAYGRRSILRRPGRAYAPNVSGRWKYRIQAMMRHPSASKVSSFIGRACVGSYTNAGIWRRRCCPALEFPAEVFFGARVGWLFAAHTHLL